MALALQHRRSLAESLFILPAVFVHLTHTWTSLPDFCVVRLGSKSMHYFFFSSILWDNYIKSENIKHAWNPLSTDFFFLNGYQMSSKLLHLITFYLGSTSTCTIAIVFFSSDKHWRTLRMLSEVFTSLVKDILFTKTEGMRMTAAACSLSPVRVRGCGKSALGQSDVSSLLVWQLPSYHNEKLGPIMQKKIK